MKKTYLYEKNIYDDPIYPIELFDKSKKTLFYNID